jgi:hypothetical protein
MAQTHLPFEWTAHPLREHVGKAVLAAVLVLACGVLVGLVVADPMASPLAAGAAILFLLITLNRFFLPSRYRIDDHGIAVRYPLRTRVLRWSEIKRFRHDEEGGYVSPRSRSGVFDTAGISLLFGTNASEIIPRIKAAIDPPSDVSACREDGYDSNDSLIVAGQEASPPDGADP